MSVKGSYTKSDYIPWDIAISRVEEIKQDRPVLAALTAFGINTGLRISDIKTVRAEAIRNNSMLVIEAKTGKGRRLVLNSWLLSFLGTCSLPTSGYLFSRTGETPVTSQSVNRGLKTVFGDLGINVSSHSLRKTFGRRVMEQNNYSHEALIKLCELFNHSSPAITRIYLGLRQEELNEMYLNLI